ncbi:hypothetical protein CBS101457_000941 [Exobasidium rhododendri]|nr:hypothetical protein CBS101457_000941 [Exobasidium rhododendri]
MFALVNRNSLLAASRAATRSRPAAIVLPGHTVNLVSHRAFLVPTAARYAANPQSGKPASDNWSHTARNIKEEAGQVATSVGKAISGIEGGLSKTDGETAQTNEILSDAKSIISEVAEQVPRPAMIWGAAGIIPYVSTAGASIYLARQTQLVAQGLDSHIDFETASALLLHSQNVQIQFGAILLSFLGAIHWGFEFSKFGGELGNKRYVLGLIPVALAWPTLMLTPQLALVSQWGAYVVTWFIDLKATNAGWAPHWYSSYRFGLTAAVGLSIIATLAGTNYYDADKSRSTRYGAGRKLAKQNAEDAPNRMALLKSNAEGNRGTFAETEEVGGDVDASQAGDDGDGFVKISNPVREEEERKKKEEKEKKEKEEKAKKEKESKAKEGEKKEDKKEDEGDDKEGGDEEDKEGDDKDK